ncbi:hypothetical protein [uncultured Algibacter sp.]|uniref:hypothetical protein n=1 Tax=uncultured Algibacter sp. TaxID=298659 RepID=UPI0026367996|nr:hypothetical protein [uncultured Algibacter sp.]
MENTLNSKGYTVQNSKKTQVVSTLNTDNKLNFFFNYEDLEIQIPGGLNDERHDRMQVTVKINKKDSYNPIRHSINLFGNTELEKFIIKVSHRLEISDITIRRAFIKLTDALESYRLETQSQEAEEDTHDFELTEEEHNEAESLLKSDDLLTKTNNLIDASGFIGEETNRLLAYLIFTSRKMDNPLHCIIHGSSGSGKTHMLGKVAEFIPNEDKIEFTQLSANAFYYFKQYQLKNKLILIEDMDGAEDGLLPLRELQTKKRISKSIVHKGIGGIGKTKNLIVEGPVSVAGCTTKESVYEDNSNRSFLLYVDESEAQDNRIMAYQRKQSAGRINVDTELEASKILRNIQRILRPVKVVNPYAEYLELPRTVFKPRRTNMHYLQLIEVITFYNQYQREEKFDESSGEAYIETSLEDIKLANTLIKDVLLRKSDRLNGATRDYFEKLNEYLKERNTSTYNNQEIRREFRIKETTLRRYHGLLETEGYIKKRPDIKSISDSYEVLIVDEFQDLENTIDKALKLCLDLATSPQVRHSNNGELKTQETSKLTQTRHKSQN